MDKTNVSVAICFVDPEKAALRFGVNVFLDAVVRAEQYVKEVPFYLTQGLFRTMYLAVPAGTNQEMCEWAFSLQQHHQGRMAQLGNERSMAVGDLLAFGDRTVWVLTGNGWVHINA